MIRVFNDESLGGEWLGHRSSRLNEQYRVIYRVERGEIRVQVVTVTAHDYRRK
jgi:Txe/YoeB family toxin of Txe-Axe toxin-antitoxin module